MNLLSNTAVAVLHMLVAGCVARPQEASKRHLVSIATTIAPSGQHVRHLASSWDGGSDEDTVLVAAQEDTVAADSVVFYAKAGPLVYVGDLPNATTADSLGSWVRAPDSLTTQLRQVPRSQFGMMVGSVLPRRLIDWTRTARPRTPYLTRIAVVMWLHGRAVRAELEVFHGV